MCVIALGTLSAEAKIFLVSVGISDYPGRQNDLNVSHKDAATIEWIYKQNKNAVIRKLTNSNATRANILSAMRNLYNQANQNDILVFFCSGHGLSDRKGASMVAYDGPLYYSEIAAIMSKTRCKNKMIFADACLSGGARTSSSNYGNLGGNVMLFLSSRTGENSIERVDMSNSIFTYALQHALRGNADSNRDRIVTAKELFTFVSAQVKKMSANRQHPVMWGKFNDQMPVMKW